MTDLGNVKEEDSAFAWALHYHKRGELLRAEELYNIIIERQPSHAYAWSLLGIIYSQQGNLDKADEYICRAIELSPEEPKFYQHLGMLNMRKKDLHRALECYNKALSLEPDVMIGIDCCFCVGNIYSVFGDYRKAVETHKVGLLSDPGGVNRYLCLAVAYLGMHEADAAIEVLLQALMFYPEDTDIYLHLGNAFMTKEDYDFAIDYLLVATRIDPRNVAVNCALGFAHANMRMFKDAIIYYRKALAEDENNIEALCGIGGVYVSSEKYEAALKEFAKAYEIAPDNIAVCERIAHVYTRMGFFEKTGEYLTKIREKKSTLATVEIEYASMLPAIYDSREQMYHLRDELVERVDLLLTKPLDENKRMTICGVPFYLAYQGMNDKDIHEKIGNVCCRVRDVRKSSKTFVKRDKIKIGFVSRHLRNHTIGKLNRGIIANLSRDKFQVEVIALNRYDDSIARFIKDNSDYYHEVVGEPNHIIKVTDRMDFDILFYTDIGMDTLTYTMAMHRLAPVQCVTWGHPVTTGLPNMDYFISTQDLESPGSEDQYTEKVVRLQSSPTYYYKPVRHDIAKTRESFGFSDEDHLYLIPQSLQKMHPDFDPIIGDILDNDPNGRVAILRGVYDSWDEILKRRFEKTIPHVVDKITFVPRQSYDNFLDLVAMADVMLDPLHFGGGNTTYEAIAFGTPVVTWPSDLLRGRITYAIYKAMGVNDCIANSWEDYFALAVRLGTDSDYRNHIRQKLLSHGDIIYEDKGFISKLEDFFCEVVRR